MSTRFRYEKGDMLHNAYGYGLFTGGLGLHGGAEKMGLTVVPVSGGMTARQVQLINDFKPKGITVTPSYILSILDEFRAQELDQRMLIGSWYLWSRTLDQFYAQ